MHILGFQCVAAIRVVGVVNFSERDSFPIPSVPLPLAFNSPENEAEAKRRLVQFSDYANRL